MALRTGWGKFKKMRGRSKIIAKQTARGANKTKIMPKLCKIMQNYFITVKLMLVQHPKIMPMYNL